MKNPNEMKQTMDAEERDFLLWRYFHKDLTSLELLFAEEQLASNIEWQEAFQEIKIQEQQLQLMETETPSLRFTKNVMESIEQKVIARPANSYVNKNIIKFIGGGFIAIVAIFLVYAIAQVNWVSNKTFNINWFKMPTVSLHLNINMGSGWVYGCFAIIIVCFFVLMDKFLSNKRKYKTT